MADTAKVWWRDGVIYQVYPRSFQDSGADGVGDLKGILARLDYLVELGVDAVWVSPIYTSPMADFGYDVADYCGVDPLFGTMADFDALLAGAHARGLKLILDFVPNHTSDQHPWFLESRSSRTNPKRDWYLWRDAAADGGVPNNWGSNFGGPAWTWDETTGQYYLHSFLPQQPDLNWRNPAVREAMFGGDALLARRAWKRRRRRWLPHGCALAADQGRSVSVEPGGCRGNVAQVYNADRPETLRIVREMRALMDGYGDRGTDRRDLSAAAGAGAILRGGLGGVASVGGCGAEARRRADAVQLSPHPDGVERGRDC